MRKRSLIVLMTVAALMTAIPLGVLSQEAPPLVRVLVVDETKTFNSTMRVAGLVGALRSVGLFDVGVALADVTSSYDDPLADRTPEEGEDAYDLIVVLPRGLDDGSIGQIWVVSAGLSTLSPGVSTAVGVATGVIDQVFSLVCTVIWRSEELSCKRFLEP